MMGRGKLIAISIGIVVAVMAGFGLAISAQGGQTDQVTITQTLGGRHFEIELKESVGVKENQPPP